MSYGLKYINIEGFRSIKKQGIDLNKMNVLIGQNGAGKTNFIALFRFLRNVIGGHLKTISQRYKAESLLYYGSKETTEISIRLNFHPNYYELILYPDANDILFVHEESVGFKSGNYSHPYYETVTRDSDESQLSKIEKGIPKYVYDTLISWRVYHFHDTSESAGMKKYAKIANSKFLFEDASNLAAFLYIMKNRERDKEYYQRITKTIRLIIPFFKDFVLEPDPLNTENIRIEWNDIYSEKTFTANELSDGSLRFICMATLLLQRNLPSIILLDEPELGLHPSAITILAGLLRKASTRSQVIVSTQSVSLVNEFEAEDIIVVEKKEAETTFRRLDAEKLETWLEEYSLGDLWDKNIIGGKP